MKSPNLKKLRRPLALSCVLILMAGFLWIHDSRAASAPYFLVTWKAQSYVPSGFEGKVLPTAGSPIVVSFDLVQDGVLVNISRETVYWYLGDTLIQSGVGIQSVFLRAPQIIGQNDISIRIQLPNYKGGNGSAAIKTLHIPSVLPEIHLIRKDKSASEFFQGNNFTLEAIPYFFNVKNLSELTFAWKANGKSVADDDSEAPNILSAALSTPAPGTSVAVEVSARNPAREFESAMKSITLTSQ